MGRKTKEEKIKSRKRRREIFSKRAEARKRRDDEDFRYLASKYIKKDLWKSLGASLLVMGVLIGLYFYKL